MSEHSSHPLDVVIDAPPSKSLTHRALVAAALAEGTSRIQGPLDAEDTRVTRYGLSALGAIVSDGPEGEWAVRGCGRAVAGGATIDLGASGTSARLLAAVAALACRPSRLDGSPRLRERPMAELAAALGALGAAITTAPDGGLPWEAGGRPMSGGTVRLRGDRSSQFASALLLVGGRLPRGLLVEVEPPVVSAGYVGLTAAVLRTFGAEVEPCGDHGWRVGPGGLHARDYRVEGDWSSASYFLAAPALLAGRVRVRNLAPLSAQPDRGFLTLLRRIGCSVREGFDWVEVSGSGHVPAFECDLRETPDLAPTVAALGLFARGACTISGLDHLRHKESNRLEGLCRNLQRLNRSARVDGGRLIIEASDVEPRGGPIETAGDHRLAMAFALVRLRLPDVQIDAPHVVTKSYPDFWQQWERITRGVGTA
jgi:3-phosphoshikimate 1-carboxyvinyltransferase